MSSIMYLTKRITMNSNKFFLLFLFLALTAGVWAQNPLNPNTWTVNPASYSETMLITGVIQVNNVEITSANYKISAFVNGQCRGVATPVYVPQLDRYLVTLFVYSNGGNEEVEFWVHDQNANVVLPVTEKLAFNSAAPVGTPANPYIFKTLQANVTFEKDDVLCAADDHGYAKATISFGNTNQDYPYTLKWSTGSTDTMINNLSAGKYYLTVTVTNLFTFVDSVEIINQNRTIQKPSLLAAPSNEVCRGDDIFVLAYSNETEDPKYYWYDIFNQPIDTTNVLSIVGLMSDKLLYAQTEVRNCRSELSSIALTVFNVPDPNFVALPSVALIGESIKFFTNQPQNPIVKLRWDFGDGTLFSDYPVTPSTVQHTYTAEGTYNVTLRATTAQGCVREEGRQVTILKPSPPDNGGGTGGDNTQPLVFSFNVNDALCSNDRSGSISAQVFNGKSPIKYAWSTGGNTSSIRNLLPGTYSVTITDADGKKGVGSAAVLSKYTGDIQPPTVIVNGGRPVCESGSIWAAAIVNNYPEAEVYWYSSPTGSNPIFQGNPLILFDVQETTLLYVETRLGGCSSQRVPVNINVKQLFSEFTASATIAPPNLAISFASIGGDPTQIYNWEFGDGTSGTGATINHIFRNPGIYEVKLTASLTNGCSETSSKVIRISEQGALGVAFNIHNVLCAEDTDGSISIEVASGTPPYAFVWSTGDFGSEISGLGVGTYSVTITDQRGLTRVQEVSITSVNPPINTPTVSINGGEVVCAGEDVILAALTNVADAEYRWYDAPTGGNLLYNGASYPLNNIQENQQVYVEAFFNGCFSPSRASALVRVTAPDATFTASAKTINEGGTINFDANVVVNNNTYNWNFGDGSTATGASTQKKFENTGLYTITLTVTDSVGCSASTAQIIRVVSAADMVISFAIKNVTCVNDQNGSVTATVFNGKPPFTFQWNNGASSNTLTNLRPGAYVVTVTDTEGQSRIETAQVVSEVGLLNPPTLALIGDSIVCPSEAVTIYAYNPQAGVLTYNWYDAPVGGNLIAVTNALTAYGRDIPNQLYVEARSGSCKSDTRSTIHIDTESPNTGFTATNTTIVEGNQVSFIPNIIDSTYTYNWFFNDGMISEEIRPTHIFDQAGTYRVRLNVITANGCSDSRFLNVNVIATNETAVVLKTTPPTCESTFNGKITAEVVNGAAPYNFIWSNGATTASIENLAEGDYTVTVVDASGVNITQTAKLTATTKKPQRPTISVNANTPICYKDDLLLTGISTEALSGYLWYDDANNLLSVGSTLPINDIAQSGTIYLAAQRNGCVSDRDSVVLTVQIPNAAFTVSQNGVADIDNNVAFLPVVATYPNYTWSFGDGNSSNQLNPQHAYTNSGTFNVTLTVKDAQGCTNTVVKENAVNVVPADILKLAFNIDPILCTADSVGSITVKPGAGTPPYTYQWSNGTSEATAGNLREGSYSVTVTDAQGRTSTGSATIQNQNIQVPPPGITVNGNAPVCKGSDAFLLSKNSQFANAKTLWFGSNTAQDPMLISDLYVVRDIENSRILYAQSQIDGCNSVRIPVEINVQAPSADFRVTPSPEVMEGQVVQFKLNQMNPSYSYYWQFGDRGWSTLPEPFYFYNLGGKFNVQLTVIDPDGCENTVMKENFVTVNMLNAPGVAPDSVEIRSGRNTGINQDAIQAAFFPNPFQQQLNVILKSETSDHYRIQIMDLLGRTYLVQEIELTANVPQQFHLETENLHLSNGMYLFQIENEHTKIIRKLIKQGL